MCKACVKHEPCLFQCGFIGSIFWGLIESLDVAIGMCTHGYVAAWHVSLRRSFVTKARPEQQILIKFKSAFKCMYNGHVELTSSFCRTTSSSLSLFVVGERCSGNPYNPKNNVVCWEVKNHKQSLSHFGRMWPFCISTLCIIYAYRVWHLVIIFSSLMSCVMSVLDGDSKEFCMLGKHLVIPTRAASSHRRGIHGWVITFGTKDLRTLLHWISAFIMIYYYLINQFNWDKYICDSLYQERYYFLLKNHQ